MENTENNIEKRYAVLNKEGLVLCIVNDSLTFLPINEVTVNNIFSFWDYRVSELKEYLSSLGQFLKGNQIDLNTDGYSFLEIEINEDINEIIFQ